MRRRIRRQGQKEAHNIDLKARTAADLQIVMFKPLGARFDLKSSLRIPAAHDNQDLRHEMHSKHYFAVVRYVMRDNSWTDLAGSAFIQ